LTRSKRHTSTPSDRLRGRRLLAIGGFAGTLILRSLVPAFRQHEVLWYVVSGVLIFGFILLIPISIGVAVLRSRLYAIDVVINRTLVYTTLTSAVEKTLQPEHLSLWLRDRGGRR